MRPALLLVILIISCTPVQKLEDAPKANYISQIKTYQKELNEAFSDAETSPLTPEDLADFEGLPFFPVNEKYRVNGKLTLTPEAEPFQMKTSTNRMPIYRKYGELEFTIDSAQLKLSIYQNLAATNNEAYKNLLFIPFKDLTSGKESYGGGRYLDLEIPDSENLVIDFNKAYNPLCAYSHRFSCPIPPKENDLAVEIKAGVMYIAH